LCSTVLDLAEWTRALVEGRAVAPASFDRMVNLEPVAAGFTPPYGYGLSVVPVSGEPAIWHTGVWFGSTASLAYFPRRDVTIAVVSNEGYAVSLLVLAEQAAQAAMELRPPALVDLEIGAAEIDQVVGVYNDYMFTITVSVSEASGGLRIDVPGLGLSEPLLRQGVNEFATPGAPTYRLWFELAGERAELVTFEWAELHSFGRRVDAASGE
jgi:CubicO group peptidase (beta-lactamase class C family)